MYLKISPFGQNIYLPIDSFGQYVPFLEYFGNVLEGKASIFYSLGKSLGGEMYGLFAYYLTSPFNIIMLFLKRGIFAFNLILVLKTASLGITFCYFLNRRKKAKFSNLIFSTLYALSVVSITYGFNIMWLDSMILLPLVMSGIEDIIKLKKVALYTISLSLTLITNYYMGFIVCIFAVIYFLYKMILEKFESKKEILKTISRFIVFSIISACIAGIILVPAFIGLINGRAEFSSKYLNFDKNFELKDFLSKFFTNAFEVTEIANNGMPPVFCSVFINFLVILYFTNKNIKLKEKIVTFIVFLIFFISFYINGINLLWVMGNIPAFYIYRYAFCFVFLYIYIAFRAFENIKTGTKLWNIIFAIFIYEIIGILVIKFNLGVANKTWVRVDMCLALATGLIILMYKIDIENSKINLFIKKNKLKALSVILFIMAISNITINDANIMKTLRDKTGPSNIKDYDLIKSYYEERHKKLSEYDGGIYRIEAKTNTGLNDGILLGDKGINHSSSTYSKSLYDFLKKLGYSQEHVIIANDISNTKAMDMLFGIKYKTEEPINQGANQEISLDKYIKVYKNPYSLSLAFSVPETILESGNVKTYDAFKYQNSILRKIADLDEEIYTKSNAEIKESVDNLIKDENGSYKRENEERSGKIIYEFEAFQNKELYMYIAWGSGLEKVKVYINGEKINNTLRGNTNKMIDLGKFEAKEKVKVEFEVINEPIRLYKSDIYVYYEDDDIFKMYYNKLSKEQMDLTKKSETEYEGKINIESDNKYVLFTIPYDEGWSAKVDGKEVEIIRVQEELMAVKVDKGEHEISLKFIPKGFYIGLTVSVLGAISFIIILIQRKRNELK